MTADELYELGRSDREAREFFVWLKSADVSYKVLGASKAEEATGLDYYSLIGLFKELDNIKAGTFIVGRKGHDSRIVWSYDTKSIGRAGIDGFNFLESLGNVPENAVTAISTPEKDKLNNGIRHTFNLRKSFPIEINLPEDFDFDDCKKLKAWLDLLIY